MTYLSLRRWNGQFGSPKVISQIRRTIQGRIASGGCVVVLDDGAAGLTDDVRAAIQQGWPSDKTRFSTIHPLLGGRTGKKS
jgi:hypothetical protein